MAHCQALHACGFIAVVQRPNNAYSAAQGLDAYPKQPWLALPWAFMDLALLACMLGGRFTLLWDPCKPSTYSGLLAVNSFSACSEYSVVVSSSIDPCRDRTRKALTKGMRDTCIGTFSHHWPVKIRLGLKDMAQLCNDEWKHDIVMLWPS